MAAIISPERGIMFDSFVIKICWRSHELTFVQNQAMARIKPISPIRLYRMA